MYDGILRMRSEVRVHYHLTSLLLLLLLLLLLSLLSLLLSLLLWLLLLLTEPLSLLLLTVFNSGRKAMSEVVVVMVLWL